MTSQAAKDFYTRQHWDERAWTDVISIEYERLIEAFPFAAKLGSLGRGAIRLLDVGCGTAIFPRHLDPVLPPTIRLDCDLLDISPLSLRQAKRILEQLGHFRVLRTLQASIEDIPSVLQDSNHQYDVVWAIHGLTTVGLDRMPEVIRYLIELLRPQGYLFVYQLTAQSSYQVLHDFYRRHRPMAGGRFMECQDTQQILERLGMPYELYELRFDHELPDSRSDLLLNYLRKCVLDETIDALEFFAPLLPSFHDPVRQIYRFPQAVGFISVTKQAIGTKSDGKAAR